MMEKLKKFTFYMKYGVYRKKELKGAHNIDVLSVLFGTLLGDCYGEKRSNKVRFHLQQESNNQEYLHWLHGFLALRGYCSASKPKQLIRIDKKGKIRYLFKIRTYSFSSLNWLYECFYCDTDGNKINKIIPCRNLLEIFLTPLTLTVWFSDDGSKAGKGLKIATNGFTMEEVQLLCQVLYDKYGIVCKPNKAGISKHTGKIQYCLYIHKESVVKFSKIIKPLMVKSMHYKLQVI